MHNMLATADLGEGVFYTFLWLGTAFWALKRLSSKCGTNGIVKDAAKRGASNLFSRLFK